MASIMQTPPRPGPGLYPQTPATSRPGVSSTSSFSYSTQRGSRPSFLQPSGSSSNLAISSSAQNQTPATVSTSQTAQLRPVERAARNINETLLRETSFPELDIYLPPGASSEYDLHDQQDAQTAAIWAPFQKVRVHNIPDELFEQHNRAQMSTSMGLFAELHHAWVTIDNALYLWDYTLSNPQLHGYEQGTSTITAVKLAIPRPGVFLPHIKHMIVLATTSDIMLLGFGLDPAPGGSSVPHMIITGMSAPIRGLDVTVIATCGKSGRVFFGGRTENEIYELTYQQEDGWFSSKCAKICHTSSTVKSLALTLTFASNKQEFVKQMVVDETRDLLYTLSSKSTIRIFHLAADGGLALLVTKTATDIFANTGHILSPTESFNVNIKIVAISPIRAKEATKYHLVATTATGYRIYLSAASSGYWATKSVGPLSMQAQHVRSPPMVSSPDSQSSMHGPIKSLTMTRLAQRFPPGYFFCFVAKDLNAAEDKLFIAAPDAARLSRPPENGLPSRSAESATWLYLESRAEDIGACTPYAGPTSTPAGFANDLAVQYDEPVPEVAILTNNGIHIIRRRRLVDIFAALIRQGGGTEGLQNQVNNMIRAYGRTEILATALAVACGQSVEVTQDSRAMRIQDPEVLEAARKIFIDYGGKPTLNQNVIDDKGKSLQIDAVRPSPRHEAITLYIARLLRSTWKSVITKEFRPPEGYTILPNVPLEKLKSIQQDLSQLQRFFNSNKRFIKGLSGPDELSRTGNREEEVALQAEHRALHSLVNFVTDTIEGLSFVLVLFEERVADIIPLLPETSRPEFLKLTFEGLISTTKGFDLAKDLVKAIVNRNIAKGSNVETVAEALRRKCGSFCSAEDVVIFKAQEQLKRAAEAETNAELKKNLLNESLRLFEDVAGGLSMDYLQAAVRQYNSLHFFAGAVRLTLTVAHQLDKGNEALSWMTDGKPEPDSRRAKFDLRSQCYDLIHDVILAVDKSVENSPTFIDGRATLVATRRNETYDVVGHSKDEVFLTNLYDWYLSQGWTDRLLTSSSPFVVIYLQRKSSDDVAYADLLWKYYGQSSQFAEAARIQLQLARSSFPLSLDKRIEYLSYARANASTHTPGGNRKQRQQLLQEISELLDVATIQSEILQQLRDDPRLPGERRKDVLGQIDGPILPITELYNDFADNAGYYDICLLIYQVADHRDAGQIKQTWQQLLQTTHDKAAALGDEGPQPFEAVADVVRSLGAKLRLSETTFPVQTLLPILERYSFQFQRNVAPAHWTVEIFLELETAYERIFEVLELLFFSEEEPFTGQNRRFIAGDLAFVVQRWFHDTVRAGGLIFGSAEAAGRVDDTLEMIVRLGRQAGVDDDLMGTLRGVRAAIARTLG